MRLIFIAVVVLVISDVQAAVCASKHTKYFQWAELKQFPAKPSEPITKAEADLLEKQGAAYYIQIVCSSGEPISLTKRWNKGIYFEIKYLYKDDQLIGQKSVNANGETNEYYIDE